MPGYNCLQMEQYAHLLISADPEFIPDPVHVAAFFDLVQRDFGFRYVKSPKEWMPGILAQNSEERVMKSLDPYTGEERLLTVPKWFELEQTAGILPFITGKAKYGVRVSGKWLPTDVPLEVVLCDGTPFEQDLICFVSCAQRAKPVCTGDWWGEKRNGACEFGFDDPDSPLQSTGIFTHPCTGKRLEAPDAGSAKYWIEFEFGKWLVPKMADSFDVLQPAFVDAVQKCFGARFVQAGRAVG
jgi:hypothetical protein